MLRFLAQTYFGIAEDAVHMAVTLAYSTFRKISFPSHSVPTAIILVLLVHDATVTVILRHLTVYTVTHRHGGTTLKNRSVSSSGEPRGVWGLFNFRPPKFRKPSKIVPNSTRLWKLLKTAEFRTPTLQDVRKKGNKILKLPSVRNCFTLAMTNKLVVIINSLKVPKIKKMLLYGMKFLVPNYSCLQNP